MTKQKKIDPAQKLYNVAEMAKILHDLLPLPSIQFPEVTSCGGGQPTSSRFHGATNRALEKVINGSIDRLLLDTIVQDLGIARDDFVGRLHDSVMEYILNKYEIAYSRYKIVNPEHKNLGPSLHIYKRPQSATPPSGYTVFRVTKKRLNSNKCEINMAVAVPFGNDPVRTTIELITKKFSISNQALLRTLFHDFLRLNDLLEVPNARLLDRIGGIETWKPFGWKSPPSKNIAEVFSRRMSFDFLTGLGPSPQPLIVDLKRSKRIGIDDDPLWTSLPYIEDRLWRNTGDFFKMLYIYFLKSHRLLDEGSYIFLVERPEAIINRMTSLKLIP